MFSFNKSSPFEEDIEKATSENNTSEDWTLIMHICDNVINYQDGAKICLKGITKRLYHDVPRVVMQALTLLDACVKNCDKRFLLQVASSEFTNEIQKMLKKMHPQAAMKLKELLQRWAIEDFKEDSELCIIPSLYYKLKSEGVDFPSPMIKAKKSSTPVSNDPNVVTSQEEENDIIKAIEISLKDTGRYNPNYEELNQSLALTSDIRSLPEPFKVRTLYDFDAAEENELTIKAGEITLVLDDSNASWWKGSNHRGEGLFPANFVTRDLDAKPDDELAATPSETGPESTTYTGQVKIDEEKMVTVINWLNDTDPAGDEPDPAEMLCLEDEVYKMASLIEENLHSIDKKMAMLNMVNEKIVSAMEMFHNLSDNLPSVSPTKYFVSPYLPGQMLSSQTSASVVYPNIANPPQHIVYMPVPASSSLPVNNHTCNSNLSSVQPNEQKELNADLASTSPSAESKNVQTPTSAQIPLVVSGTYPAPIQGFYVQPSTQLPLQYSQVPIPSPGGAVQNSNPVDVPNMGNFQVTAPPIGSYFQIPFYYTNSASFQTSHSVSSAENKSSNSSQAPLTTVVKNESSGTQSMPCYSTDLQTLAINSLPSSNIGLQEQPNKQIIGDIHQQ